MPVAAVNPPHKQKAGSVGPAIPETEMKIINPNEEGFLFITGRKKSVIITRSGLNIFPEEVESVMFE